MLPSVSPAARCPGTTSWRQFHEEEVMKKTAVLVVTLVAILAIAPSAFAQGGAAEKAPVNTTTLALAVGFGLAIAAFGGALGQGRIASAAFGGNRRQSSRR